MSYRFYKCGCSPDFDEWCKEADKRVWAERDAHTNWFISGGDESHLDGVMPAREWMRHHLAVQDATGKYTDVEEKDLEPPDDGYDEDPRVVGYPS
jgi:hypothetical protein